ncbi:MAG: MBL fold metallo-hydrolase [Gammaproteobacteria bacterium]
MKYQILSHAGLAVSAGDKTVICDPWLIGSTYWRSWFNYPPPAPELIDSLKPDCIYLTHIHWDHFAGPSLRLFDPQTPIVIPKEPAGRMARDLRRMGLNNIIELEHGGSYNVGGGIRLTSYQFFVFTDSAVVIEADGEVLLNANDAKLMGGPLKQVLKRHPNIDVVFRSHSSANSRICYEVIDAPETVVDDRDVYIKNFANFVQATGARYAVPFASNHCHLHRDVFDFNNYACSPQEVADYYQQHNIGGPELKLMISGDYWSNEDGFVIQEHDWFEKRDERLIEYRDAMSDKLEKTYEREARAKVNIKRTTRYFEGLSKAMPFFYRYFFKNDPLLYVLNAGDKKTLVEVDLYRGKAREIESYTDTSHPMQIHTDVALFNHCMAADLFSHLAISKRVKYRMMRDKRRLLRSLSYFFNFYEYDVVPVRNIQIGRFLRGWMLRWREIALFIRIGIDLALGRGFAYERYLKMP